MFLFNTFGNTIGIFLDPSVAKNPSILAFYSAHAKQMEIYRTAITGEQSSADSIKNNFAFLLSKTDILIGLDKMHALMTRSVVWIFSRILINSLDGF